MSRSRSNIADVIRQPSPLRSSGTAAAAMARPSVGADHVQRDQRCHRDRREAGERAELLGGADVGRSGGDPDGNPDRPAGQEGREEDLGEQIRGADQGRRHPGMSEEFDAREEQAIDDVGDRNRGEEGGQGLAQQQLLAANRSREHGLERALLTLADHE